MKLQSMMANGTTAIKEHFAKKAHVSKLKKDWKMVHQEDARWLENGKPVHSLIFFLWENGLKERKMTYTSSCEDDPKEHRLYKLRILPWLKGVSMDNFPPTKKTVEPVAEEVTVSKSSGNVVYVNFQKR